MYYGLPLPRQMLQRGLYVDDVVGALKGKFTDFSDVTCSEDISTSERLPAAYAAQGVCEHERR